MHELSVAMSLLDVVTEHLIRSQAAGARSFTVEIGDLSGVAPGALQTAYAVAVRGTDLATTRMQIIRIPVAMQCPVCKRQTDVVAANALRCRECGAPAEMIVRGRELDVVAIEVVEHGTENPAGPNQDPQGQ